jgi:hypothetical protein
MSSIFEAPSARDSFWRSSSEAAWKAMPTYFGSPSSVTWRWCGESVPRM